MTIATDPVVNHCEPCDIEYVSVQHASCPLCPLRVDLEVASVVVWNSEPFRVAERVGLDLIQAAINHAAADGWKPTDLWLVHEGDPDPGNRVYCALLLRPDYDPERHRSALDAQRKAILAEAVKSLQIRRETETFQGSPQTIDCA